MYLSVFVCAVGGFGFVVLQAISLATRCAHAHTNHWNTETRSTGVIAMVTKILLNKN